MGPAEKACNETLDTMMAHRKVVIAARRPSDAWATYRQLTEDLGWQVVGIADPRTEDALASFSGDANIMLIEADDLLWLLDHRPEPTRRHLRSVRPIVQLRQHQILEVVSRGQATWGLLLWTPGERLTERLELAIQGYLVMPGTHWGDLQQDRQRLEIVAQLSAEERRILGLLGAALPNSAIAGLSELSEARVKALTHALRRKLRLKNRTAVAVFSIENGFALLPLL